MRNRYLLGLDLLLFTLAALGAYALRFDWWFFRTRADAWPFLVAALTVKPGVFLALGLYNRYWQYASTGDFAALLIGNAAASVTLATLVPLGLALGIVDEFPRSVIFMDFLIALAFTGGMRFFVRVVSDSQMRARKSASGARVRPRRLLIVGAGEAGALVAREARKNPQLGFDIVGFLDDDRAKQGKRIAGIRVLGGLSSLEHVLKTYRIDEVAIAIPTAPGGTIRVLAETCRQLGVVSKTVPGVFELLGDRVSVRRLREVHIDDLLKRNPVRTVADPGYLADRCVLVTGGGGSIGSELCRQVAVARPRRLVLLGHGENSIFDIEQELARAFPALPLVPFIADIRDTRRIHEAFALYRPHVVFHAAAHKHVPLMEANPEEAVSNNVLGTARVLQAALDSGAERFVFISSDKAVRPTNVMGASKRLGEELVREAARLHGRNFVVVRFGNVLGSRGSVVPLFQKQIERGGPITLTHPEMRRFFMTIPEAAHLVLQAGGLGRGGEVFVLNMGEDVLIEELARDLIRLSGAESEDIPIVYTGMRPGEKLTEELWEEDAVVETTAHHEVFRVREPDRGDVAAMFPSIMTAAAAREWAPPHVVRTLVEACRKFTLAAASEPDGRR